jgi:two-component system response regulator HydG
MSTQAPRGHVLVVDDDEDLGQFIADIARDDGFEATSISNPLDALGRLEAGAFDLVVTDVRMPGMDGVELIGRIKAFDPRIAVIAITAFGSLETAVRAMRAGA